MSIAQPAKIRKPKVNRAQTYNGRRRADRARREWQRPRAERRRREQHMFKFRVRVVRMYSQLRQQVAEKRAVELTLARWQPTKPEHLPLSKSSIRQWYRTVQQQGYVALRPQSTRPKTVSSPVPFLLVSVIFTLRTLLGWGGHRISAELRAREIGQVSARTVYKVFERLGLPVHVYALKGRSDGIAYQAYEKKRPNAQWHIDLKHVWLADGTKAYICILIDDYSRYALAAIAGTSATTAWVAQVTAATLRRCGAPAEIVSDNGREFVSVYEDCPTLFGHLLKAHEIDHLTTAPYYPQGNGKAEAFIKILTHELLLRHMFATIEELQAALDRYLTFYNNYRRHSACGWQPPVCRYTGRTMTIRGLAGLPGLEAMATDPHWGESYCDPPVEITPQTASTARALVVWTPPAAAAAA